MFDSSLLSRNGDDRKRARSFVHYVNSCAYDVVSLRAFSSFSSSSSFFFFFLFFPPSCETRSQSVTRQLRQQLHENRVTVAGLSRTTYEAQGLWISSVTNIGTPCPTANILQLVLHFTKGIFHFLFRRVI